jgi:tetratricopeptide (TPR) repeat protein
MHFFFHRARRICACFATGLFLQLFAVLVFFGATPALADLPDDCSAACAKAIMSLALFDQNPMDGAEKLCQAANACPQNRTIVFNLGLAKYRLNQKEQAYNLWKGLAQSGPASARLFVMLGWTALELGKHDQAWEWVFRDELLARSDPGAIAVALEVLFARGHYEKALALAWEHGENIPDHYRRKAEEFAVEALWQRFKAGEKEGAAKTLSKLSEKMPQNPRFATARDFMVAALVDETLSMPYAQPLPHVSRRPVYLGDNPNSGSPDIANLEITLPQTGCSWAFLAGIDEYRYFLGPPHAVNDSLQLARLLTRVSGFAPGPYQIRTAVNRDAQKENLLDGLGWLAQKAAFDTRCGVLFYFSGLALPLMDIAGEKGVDLLLLPHDTPINSADSERGILLSQVKQMLSGLKNEGIIVIMDLRRPFWASGKEPAEWDSALFEWDNTLMLSLNGDRAINNIDSAQSSAFSFFLMHAMMGRADRDHDGWVDTAEAFAWASSRISSLGLDMELKWSQSRPLRLSRVNAYEH